MEIINHGIMNEHDYNLSKEWFEQGEQLALCNTLYAFIDGEPVVIWYLDSMDGKKRYKAVHHLKIMDSIFNDYYTAKKKLDFVKENEGNT